MSQQPTTAAPAGKQDPEAYTKYLAVTNAPPVYTSADELNAYFGQFGGCFVAETLIQAHHNLVDEYVRATQDPSFRVRDLCF